jgi:CheY-like chemotaxis protein
MLKMEMNSGILQKGICIANTAFVDIDTKIRCHKEGMDFYLSKPIRIKEL